MSRPHDRDQCRETPRFHRVLDAPATAFAKGFRGWGVSAAIRCHVCGCSFWAAKIFCRLLRKLPFRSISAALFDSQAGEGVQELSQRLEPGLRFGNLGSSDESGLASVLGTEGKGDPSWDFQKSGPKRVRAAAKDQPGVLPAGPALSSQPSARLRLLRFWFRFWVRKSFLRPWRLTRKPWTSSCRPWQTPFRHSTKRGATSRRSGRSWGWEKLGSFGCTLRPNSGLTSTHLFAIILPMPKVTHAAGNWTY